MRKLISYRQFRLNENTTDEIDRILDKILSVGYDNLSEEEKNKLESASKKEPKEVAPPETETVVSVENVDDVLDRMSEVGYDNLTDEEKEILNNPDTTLSQIRDRGASDRKGLSKEFILDFMGKIFMIKLPVQAFDKVFNANGVRLNETVYTFITSLLRKMGINTTRPIIRSRVKRFYGVPMSINWIDKEKMKLIDLMLYVKEHEKGEVYVDMIPFAKEFFKFMFKLDLDNVLKSKPKEMTEKQWLDTFMLMMLVVDKSEENIKRIKSDIKEKYGKDIGTYTLMFSTIYDLLSILREGSGD